MTTKSPQICIFNDNKRVVLHTLYMSLHFYVVLAETTPWSAKAADWKISGFVWAGPEFCGRRKSTWRDYVSVVSLDIDSVPCSSNSCAVRAHFTCSTNWNNRARVFLPCRCRLCLRSLLVLARTPKKCTNKKRTCSACKTVVFFSLITQICSVYVLAVVVVVLRSEPLGNRPDPDLGPVSRKTRKRYVPLKKKWFLDSKRVSVSFA